MIDDPYFSSGGYSTETVFIICPYIVKAMPYGFDPIIRLEEAKGLAQAIHLNIKGAEYFKQHAIRAPTYLSKGHVENFQPLIKALNVDLVFIDAPISPVQQRNLEKAWQCKVIDRTGLILEIFGERARIAEGRLQVELAALSYQRTRLVRSWTHLERQRGGFGFTGGPGETQLELDRRLIDDRIARIKKELEDVQRTRSLHRRARKRVPYPIVSLVGYTNAGKSTLFNSLTHAQVVAADVLFATLDPTMRRVRLPSGREIILSDTVGFIADLPTFLVAAFRATLEEVKEADVILHVRDVAHTASQDQSQDVVKILKELEIYNYYEENGIEILNKCDLLDAEENNRLEAVAIRAHHPEQCVLSALNGQGIPLLLEKIDNLLSRKEKTYHLSLSLIDGKRISWVYSHGSVLERRDDEQKAYITVKMSLENYEKFYQYFEK